MLIPALVLAIGTSVALAGGDEIPAVVKSKFASEFPNVKKVKWEKEKGNYEAEFDLNKVETSVLYDASGNKLETETEIAVSSLPKSAADYISKNFADKKIREASKIVDAKNTVTYEAEVKGVGDVIFDANGNFLKKEVEQDEDKDKEKKK